VAAARAALQKFKDAQATFALRAEYTSGLKTIGELRGELAQIEARLQGLRKTYTTAHSKVKAAEAERDRLRQSIDVLEAKRGPLAAKENELSDHELRLQILESDYSVVSKALAEARIQESSQANDVRVVSPAQPPTYPVAPIRVYYAGIGAAAALVFGVFMILLADSLSARVRCIEDAQGLGLPVLATFPSIASRSNV